MKKALRGTCRRVGREVFVDGLANGLRLVGVVLLFLILWGVVSCSQKDVKEVRVMPITPEMVVTSEKLVWKTNPENKRQKVPVVEEVNYIVWDMK